MNLVLMDGRLADLKAHLPGDRLKGFPAARDQDCRGALSKGHASAGISAKDRIPRFLNRANSAAPVGFGENFYSLSVVGTVLRDRE
jgi:hypothetical protein